MYRLLGMDQVVAIFGDGDGDGEALGDEDGEETGGAVGGEGVGGEGREVEEGFELGHGDFGGLK